MKENPSINKSTRPSKNQALLSLQGLHFETLLVDYRNHIFTLTLNRPAKKNALNSVMINELNYALDYAKQERDIRVVVIAAAGDVFCAGGDLKAMSGQGSDSQSTVPLVDDKPDGSEAMVLRLYQLDKPVIANIQGSVFAGALLIVCNATHAIAADHAQFSAPEIKRGLWPFQVMAGLFHVMPQRDGLDFIMRGEPINSAAAVRTGLINEALPAAELDSRVATLAQELAALAPNTMNMGLRCYRAQRAMNFEAALPYLKTQFLECVQTPDAQEGIKAFFEKRKPQFT